MGFAHITCEGQNKNQNCALRFLLHCFSSESYRLSYKFLEIIRPLSLTIVYLKSQNPKYKQYENRFCPSTPTYSDELNKKWHQKQNTGRESALARWAVERWVCFLPLIHSLINFPIFSLILHYRVNREKNSKPEGKNKSTGFNHSPKTINLMNY